MHVRVKATGKTMHVARDSSTELMLAAGLIEEIKPEPPKPGTAVWSLTNPAAEGSEYSHLTIRAACDVCAQKIWGSPRPNMADVNKLVFWHCGKGERPPAHVAAEYVKAGGGLPFPKGQGANHQPEPKYSESVLDMNNHGRTTKIEGVGR